MLKLYSSSFKQLNFDVSVVGHIILETFSELFLTKKSGHTELYCISKIMAVSA